MHKEKKKNPSNIPNLSKLRQRSESYGFERSFGIKSNNSGELVVEENKAYAWIINFIRLVDLTLDEYENGRIALKRQKNEDDFKTVVRAQIKSSGHFETCINTLKTSINYLKRIQDPQADVPQSLKDLLPRDLRVLQGPVETQIRNMRNAIQHLEEHIQDGRHPLGKPFAVMPIQDYLQLGDNKIKFTDLAEWISELHIVTEKLLSQPES